VFLIDGFPRFRENLESWEKIVNNNYDVKFLLFFDCDLKILEARI